MEIDFGHELGLRGVGWAWGERWVIIVGIVVAREWVRLVEVRRRYISCESLA